MEDWTFLSDNTWQIGLQKHDSLPSWRKLPRKERLFCAFQTGYKWRTASITPVKDFGNSPLFLSAAEAIWGLLFSCRVKSLSLPHGYFFYSNNESEPRGREREQSAKLCSPNCHHLIFFVLTYLFPFHSFWLGKKSSYPCRCHHVCVPVPTLHLLQWSSDKPS